MPGKTLSSIPLSEQTRKIMKKLGMFDKHVRELVSLNRSEDIKVVANSIDVNLQELDGRTSHITKVCRTLGIKVTDLLPLINSEEADYIGVKLVKILQAIGGLSLKQARNISKNAEKLTADGDISLIKYILQRCIEDDNDPEIEKSFVNIIKDFNLPEAKTNAIIESCNLLGINLQYWLSKCFEYDDISVSSSLKQMFTGMRNSVLNVTQEDYDQIIIMKEQLSLDFSLFENVILSAAGEDFACRFVVAVEELLDNLQKYAPDLDLIKNKLESTSLNTNFITNLLSDDSLQDPVTSLAILLEYFKQVDLSAIAEKFSGLVEDGDYAEDAIEVILTWYQRFFMENLIGYLNSSQNPLQDILEFMQSERLINDLDTVIENYRNMPIVNLPGVNNALVSDVEFQDSENTGDGGDGSSSSHLNLAGVNDDLIGGVEFPDDEDIGGGDGSSHLMGDHDL